MPIREKKIYSGDYLEIEVFPITKEQRKEPRRKKEKITTNKQRNLNDKNAKKHLIRLTNNNFTNRDIAVHLTYDEENLPQSEEEAKRDVTNYIRRLKHYRKKNNLPDLKYIAVIEYKEQEEGKKSVRMHHHLVINGGIDRDIVEELWGKGIANADRLKADNFGYEGLARYISKDPKGNKRWTQSKNLKQPVVRVNDWRFTKRKVEQIAKCPDDRVEFEKLYPGYTLNSCEVKLNDVIGATYIYIKMRKLKI